MFWVTWLQDGIIPIDVDLYLVEQNLPANVQYKQEIIFCDIHLLEFGGQFMTWLTEHINTGTKQGVYIQLILLNK